MACAADAADRIGFGVAGREPNALTLRRKFNEIAMEVPYPPYENVLLEEDSEQGQRINKHACKGMVDMAEKDQCSQGEEPTSTILKYDRIKSVEAHRKENATGRIVKRQALLMQRDRWLEASSRGEQA